MLLPALQNQEIVFLHASKTTFRSTFFVNVYILFGCSRSGPDAAKTLSMRFKFISQNQIYKRLGIPMSRIL